MFIKNVFIALGRAFLIGSMLPLGYLILKVSPDLRVMVYLIILMVFVGMMLSMISGDVPDETPENKKISD